MIRNKLFRYTLLFQKTAFFYFNKMKFLAIFIFIIIFIYFIYFAWAYTGTLEILWQPKSIINSRFFVIKVVFTVLISLYLAYKGQFRKLLFATIIIGPYHVIRNIIMFTFRYYETRVTYFEGVFYKAYGFVFTHQFNVFERAQYVRQKAKEHGINLGDQEILTIAEKNLTISELDKELQARAAGGGFTNILNYLEQISQFVQEHFYHIITVALVVTAASIIGYRCWKQYKKQADNRGESTDEAPDIDLDILYISLHIGAFVTACFNSVYYSALYYFFGEEIHTAEDDTKEKSKSNTKKDQ